MWTRRFLWVGVVSSVMAGALVLGGIWGLLLAAEWATARFLPSLPLKDGMEQARVWIPFGIPGAIVYAACWHRIVFARRDYSRGNTVFLVLVSYCAALIVGGIVTLAALMFGALLNPVTLLSAIMSLLLLAAMVLLVFLPVAAAMLVVPYFLVATPAAFLQRAVLLRAFNARAPLNSS